MLKLSSIEMSKIMEVQQQLMWLGLDDQIQEMREASSAVAEALAPEVLKKKFPELVGTKIDGAICHGFPCVSLNPAKFGLRQPPPEEDKGEWYLGIKNMNKLGYDIEFEMRYEEFEWHSKPGEGGMVDIGGIPCIDIENMNPGLYKEFEMLYKSGEGGMFYIGRIPSWISIENMNPGFYGEFDMRYKCGGGGMFDIVGIPSCEIRVVDTFLDHKGNDHVVYIYEDPDVNNANGFVSRGHKKPRATRFIAKAGAVAGAWGMILGMATYLPQEIQWIAAVAAAIPTLAVIFA